MNEKLLLAAVLCFGIFLSLTVNATITDGNYVMTQFTVGTSGETMNDSNYSVELSSVGEMATSQTIKDASSYSAGIGFFGNPLVSVTAIIAPIVLATESITKTILAILPKTGNSIIGIILLAIIASFVLFYVFIRKKLPTKEKAIDDNEKEYVDEEEGESEEDGAV